MIDRRAEPAVSALARELFRVAGSTLVGVYVHGSAVLGDFAPGRSDLDLIVVVDDDTDEVVVHALGEELARERDVPATGLEVSIVERSAARTPRPPWRFRLHVTTATGDRKVVSGAGHPGDDDLILHYLVTRARGWCARGVAVDDVFGAVPRDAVVEQLGAELRWALDAGAPGSYAVLNACRALRFAADGEICSKTEGGTWAMDRGLEPAIVGDALRSRARSSTEPPGPEARAWVASVAASLGRR